MKQFGLSLLLSTLTSLKLSFPFHLFYGLIFAIWQSLVLIPKVLVLNICPYHVQLILIFYFIHAERV